MSVKPKDFDRLNSVQLIISLPHHQPQISAQNFVETIIKVLVLKIADKNFYNIFFDICELFFCNDISDICVSLWCYTIYKDKEKMGINWSTGNWKKATN